MRSSCGDGSKQSCLVVPTWLIVAMKRFAASFKGRNLGSFPTLEEACLARARAAAEHAAKEEAEAADDTPMTAEEALAAAEAEGLPLVPSKQSASGYLGVGIPKDHRGKFSAGHASQFLGTYETAEEAALEYARYIGKEKAMELAAEEARPMTKEEVEAAVEAEGLTLVLSAVNKSSGFKGVRDGYRGWWSANVNVEGGNCVIGNYRTPLEAALAIARHLGPDGSKAAAQKEREKDYSKNEREMLTTEQALAAAEAEGLGLARSMENTSGLTMLESPQGPPSKRLRPRIARSTHSNAHGAPTQERDGAPRASNREMPCA